MPNVFIAGATGYTGNALAQQLPSHGFTTYAHVRSDSPHYTTKKLLLESYGCTVDSTPYDAHLLREIFQTLKPVYVFSVVGTTYQQQRSNPNASYKGVDVRINTLLAQALQGAHWPMRVVFLSSIGASIHSKNPYLHTRAHIEELWKQTGVCYTVVRPSFITGPNRTPRRWAESFAASATDVLLKPLCHVGLSQFYHRWRSIDDVALARALIHVAQNPAYANTVVPSHTLQTLQQI
jgi:nucleoside-diphosphate-sugar epimerase